MGVRIRLRDGETIQQGLKRLRRDLEKNGWNWELRRRVEFVPQTQQRRRAAFRRWLRAQKRRR